MGYAIVQNVAQPNTDVAITIQLNADATPGIYNFNLLGFTDSVSHLVSITMIITEDTSTEIIPFDFILTPTEPALVVRQGLTGNLDFHLRSLTGFGTVYFYMEGFPDDEGNAVVQSFAQPNTDVRMIVNGTENKRLPH
jgi:hypothetical protein